MNVYEIITEKIIEQLDKGVIPWERPWETHAPMNLISKKPYRGVNVLLLSFTGFKSPFFLTFKQAQDLGGHVKAGKKGFPIVYYSMVKRKSKGSSDSREAFPMLRYHTVFNVEQCEGITVPDAWTEFHPLIECEAVINGMPNRPVIRFGGNQAYYRPSTDKIQMPHKEDFKGGHAFYACLFHEVIHSTGHASRLDRKSIAEPHAFGSDTYSKEELIAEIGASFLCAETGISNHVIENQANYLGNWLKRLQDDKRLIITAASQAQKAVDFILNRGEME